MVVDTFAEARERDVLNLAEEMDAGLEVYSWPFRAFFKRV